MGIRQGTEIASLAHCGSYQITAVRQAVKKLFEPWGGIGYFIKDGQRVLLKPNLLAAAAPNEAVTTHPVVVKILTETVQQLGCQVYIGDSPGSDSEQYTHRVTGIQDVADKTGANIIYFDHFEDQDTDAKNELKITDALKKVDIIINVAKLKTHSLTGLTGAVKNVFGCVAGRHKGRMHFNYPLPIDFSRKLIDVYLAVKPQLSIIDAVIGMEGIGPRRGKPKHLGLLMASENAVALDRVAAYLTGFSSDQVTTNIAAKERNLLGTELSEIDIRGGDPEQFRAADFDRGVVTGGKVLNLLTRFPVKLISNLFETKRPYPIILKENCNSCGGCSDGCPPQIIQMKENIPDLDLERCIRCYCCLELCPTGAVTLQR